MGNSQDILGPTQRIPAPAVLTAHVHFPVFNRIVAKQSCDREHVQEGGTRSTTSGTRVGPSRWLSSLFEYRIQGESKDFASTTHGKISSAARLDQKQVKSLCNE